MYCAEPSFDFFFPSVRLSWCGLTQKCCDHIGSALSSDSSHLLELDLRGNNLQGPDMHLLCAGLRSPHCKLKTLRSGHVGSVDTTKNVDI